MGTILPAPTGVIGTGTMGQGLAQALVEQGVDVVLIGRRPDAFNEIRDSIARAARLGARRKRTTKELAEQGIDRLRIADSFDALTTGRPGRAAVAPYKALQIMKEEMGTQFDPSLFSTFVRAIGPMQGLG